MTEMSDERVHELLEMAEKATPGWWHAALGSGHNVCTAIVAEDEQGNVKVIADVLPDWFCQEERSRLVPTDQQIANLKLLETARSALPLLAREVLELRKRLAESETIICEHLKNLPAAERELKALRERESETRKEVAGLIETADLLVKHIEGIRTRRRMGVLTEAGIYWRGREEPDDVRKAIHAVERAYRPAAPDPAPVEQAKK